MSENLNDFISIVVLLSVPIGVLFFVIKRLLSKKKRRKKEEVGKYYPEW